MTSLQKMVDICASHAADNDLLFSTDPDPLKSKTVCIAFHCKNKDDLANIKLNDDPLPWKTSAKHIGNILHEDGTMDTDIRTKRATFINTCMNLNNQFCFVKPNQQVKLMYIYNSHFTGSSSWNFNSVAFQQIISSWNVNIKAIYDLDYGTHNYLIEGLTDGRHAKQMIYKKYVNFLGAIAKNRRHELVHLLNIVKDTCSSLTGANMRKVLLDSNVRIIPGKTKGFELANYIVNKPPVGEEWRLPLLVSLLEIRDSNWELNFDEEVGNFKEDEITNLISTVCVG